jgi:hypothetical protein
LKTSHPDFFKTNVAERSCATQEREASGSAAAPSMANKVEDDLRDDERGAENDTQNSDPHASRSFI